eukprot:scaffold2388_cov57-Cyclotella_meneghiniana.AAC.1
MPILQWLGHHAFLIVDGHGRSVRWIGGQGEEQSLPQHIYRKLEGRLAKPREKPVKSLQVARIQIC